jgi:hypothetical protein
LARLFPNVGATPASPGFYEDTNSNSAYDAGVDYLVNDAGNRLDLADGTTNLYVKATGTIRAQNVNPVNFSAPFDYGTPEAFKAGVDLSVAGMMRDCGECHVGGGALEYLPKAGSTDLSAGTCEDAEVVYNDVTYQSATREAGTPVPCSAATGAFTEAEQYDPNFSQCGMYNSSRGMRNFICTPNPANQRTELRSATLTGVNAFNSFIDQFDEDNDGETGEVLTQDYSQTGVLEMDCLMCHMEGFSWEARTESLRKGEFDASRVTGAGLGTAINGTTVAYDPTVVGISTSSTSLNALKLGAAGFNVHPTVSENCASCHADMHQVDWKKRGDYWGVPYEADVHGALGCMGCHERKDETYYSGAYRTYNDLTKLTGQGGSSLLGHDPAKGNAPYSSLWNNTDSSMKNCGDCHKANATVENYGAVDPTPRHEALGLTSLILQTGVDGTRNASHLDLLECSTCHVRKLGQGPTAAEGGDTHGSLYEWGTGGAMVDGTGADEAGRLTDHENLYVERTMEDNLALAWQGGKLIKTNALTTMFWRDKNDTTLDINADGQIGGMDAVNPSHIRDANKAIGLHSLSADGVIDAAEIEAQRQALLSYLPTAGINVTGAALKLNFMGVMFKVNHNVNPASRAWGAGGCTDCHGPDKGFYNGAYELKGRDLNFSYAATDTVPLTMVNGTQTTDFHPSLYAKPSQGDNRSIAVNIRNGGASGATTALRDIDRAEALWETTLRVPIIPTQGGAAISTRADWVNYLNSRVTGSHNRHVAAGYGKCTTCHDDGAGNIDYNTVSAAGSPFAFTYTPDPLGNPGTCSANACHGNNGFSMENYWVLPEVTPQLSALSSADTDLVVELNASRSYCPNGCEYTFDYSAGGGILQGGNGTDMVTVQYPAAGSYTARVRVTDSVSGEVREETATAIAKVVQAPQAAMDFATAVNGNTVTLTAPTLDASVVRAYIYWGDRLRTVSTNPQADLVAGISHTYTRGGRAYNIRVQVIDVDHNKTDYIFSDDGDLTVTLP